MNPEKLSCEILHCIDKALDNRMPYFKNKLYFELLTSYDLRLGDIANHPEMFTSALGDILGQQTAAGIERAIVKEIMRHFQLVSLDCYRFTDVLKASRRVLKF